jgi:hypothetical protein
LAAVAAASASNASAASRLAFGRHEVELCVATTPAAPNCGPAQADLRRDGTMSVRVDDIVYHLTLHSSQLDVLLMHNKVQIDDFTARYEWTGNALRFSDDDRHARYEIRFPEHKHTRANQ